MLDRVRIGVDFPFGSGSCSDPNAALLRPFRQLATTGKPVGRINYVFLQNGEEHYVLGSLCHTPGERLLFYPGLRNRAPLWQRSSGKTATYRGRRGDALDHVTLEPDLKTWHPRFLDGAGGSTKLKASDSHRSSFATARRGDLVFWFSLAIRQLGCLELLPSNVQIEWEVPGGDAARRVEEVMKARDGAVFHIAQFNPSSEFDGPWYVFVSFVIDTRRIPRKAGLNWALVNAPTTAPMVSPTLDGELTIPIRSHRVRIPEYPFVVWVSVGVIPTNLQEFMIPGSYS